MITKICSCCKKELEVNIINFHYQKKGKYGFTSICKNCVSLKNKIYRSSNDYKIKAKEKARLYRIKNKEKCEQQRKKSYEKNKKKYNEIRKFKYHNDVEFRKKNRTR